MLRWTCCKQFCVHLLLYIDRISICRDVPLTTYVEAVWAMKSVHLSHHLKSISESIVLFGLKHLSAQLQSDSRGDLCVQSAAEDHVCVYRHLNLALLQRILCAHRCLRTTQHNIIHSEVHACTKTETQMHALHSLDYSDSRPKSSRQSNELDWG